MPDPANPPRSLHIVQGGIQNGDKSLLERLARDGQRTRSWVVPKSVAPGDDVVIYIRGFGFFATARVESRPKSSPDWANRYGAALDSISLIRPPISLAAIRRHIPNLDWAKYPRSIATPLPEIAERIQALINARKRGEVDLDEDFVESANFDELLAIAMRIARSKVPAKRGTALFRTGSAAIRRCVLMRAGGLCEGCGAPAPFRGADGKPFLETHHTTRKADGGPDHPWKVIGICPNCHKRAHHGEDAKSFNTSLIRKLQILRSAR